VTRAAGKNVAGPIESILDGAGRYATEIADAIFVQKFLNAKLNERTARDNASLAGASLQSKMANATLTGAAMQPT
jgi:hypothetical protein